MRIASLNIGGARQVMFRGEPVGTGIYKEPVTGPVQVQKRTLEGDRQVDLRFHGGPEKAVYCYPLEHYVLWRDELGREDLLPGQFGENFTTEGLTEDSVHIGDQLAVGTAVFEVSQPRVPCFKLGIKMGDPGFLKKFTKSERSGFYLRVIETGTVQVNDEIRFVARGTTGLTVREVNHLRFFDTTNQDALRRALEEPGLSITWREELGEMLSRA